ncbi:hypothetical protein JW865_07570 [Candidatus Bathyarchaeota archaeon]|nr:hypothetical protein [Candidatus Bathyarchaeota archaeon]
MDYIRILIGGLVGSILLIMEGGPLFFIIEALHIPSNYFSLSILFLVGLIAGLISASGTSGAISSLSTIPITFIFYFFAFQSNEQILDYLTRRIQLLETIQIITLIIGGLIGGIITSKLIGKEEKISLKIR